MTEGAGRGPEIATGESKNSFIVYSVIWKKLESFYLWIKDQLFYS